MARSPFQGTWQDGVRPTVAMAPDAIVFINGETEVLGCSSCRRKFDLNQYITSVQVDLNVDSAPGSASISLSIPRHTIDEFFHEGDPIITPMMEVEIYSKGYFLVEGVPQYYPIFWGLVTEVSDNYASGEHTVTISCADILKWWELCKMNINPAFTQQGGQLGRNYIHGTLFNANVYDVIWTLAQQSFGDIVQATGSLVSTFREQTRKEAFNRAKGSIINYWTQRFQQMRGNLLLYGTRGAAVRGDLLYASQKNPVGNISQKWASQAVRQANGGTESSQLYFNPDDVVPFRSNLGNAGQPNFWQSEYQSKLELANACKEAVGFEFYMDVTGDIVFKPPFYNLDVLSNKPVSWIQDIDIIDWGFSDSEAEVITHLQMQGSFEGGAMDMGVTSDYNTPYTQVIDYHLLRKYGWRTQTYNAEYLSNTQAMFYMGLDLLDRYNSKRHRATVTVPIRPELRLGFPVYIAPKDQIWYIQGISHSITMGGRAQTQLTLTAKRSKFTAPRGIGSLDLVSTNKSRDEKQRSVVASTNRVTSETSKPLQDTSRPSAQQLSKSSFKMKIGQAAQIPAENLEAGSLDNDPYAPLIMRHPKTNRVVGYPNVALAYTRPFTPSDQNFQKTMGQKSGNDRGTAKKIRKVTSDARGQNLEIQKEAVTQTPEKDLVDQHMNNRYMYGMTSAGVYTYVHDRGRDGKTGVIQELVQLPAANISVSFDGGDSVDATKLLGKSATIRPVSDERGFELIGHYRYGRGVALRDGSLVLSDPGGKNKRANIDTQLALSGGLFESLQAQSAGLAALTNSYPNPADAIARLQPEDLQTAATKDPDSDAGKLVSQEANFVDVAPFGSPENEGLPTNVEASQFSNALTVAELAPKDKFTPRDSSCACLTGRADLAFINVGYQVSFISDSIGDESDLATTASGTGKITETQEIQAIQSEIASVEAEIAQRQDDPLQDIDPTAYQATLDNLNARLQDLNSQLQVAQNIQESFVDPNSNAAYALSNSRVPDAGDVVSRVETFLVDLYQALDEPHQQFEQTLRGKFLPGPTREQIINGTAGPDENYSNLKPPFSPIGRARGGDLEALALQGSTARNNLTEAWQDFGTNLQNNTRKGELQSRIEQLESTIADLNSEEERLLEAQAAGNTIISPDGSIAERLNSIQAERSKARQQLDKARHDLQSIRNKEAQS